MSFKAQQCPCLVQFINTIINANNHFQHESHQTRHIIMFEVEHVNCMMLTHSASQTIIPRDQSIRIHVTSRLYEIQLYPESVLLRFSLVSVLFCKIIGTLIGNVFKLRCFNSQFLLKFIGITWPWLWLYLCLRKLNVSYLLQYDMAWNNVNKLSSEPAAASEIKDIFLSQNEQLDKTEISFMLWSRIIILYSMNELISQNQMKKN